MAAHIAIGSTPHSLSPSCLGHVFIFDAAFPNSFAIKLAVDASTDPYKES